MTVGMTPSQLGGSAADSPPPAPSAPAPSAPAPAPAASSGSDIIRSPVDPAVAAESRASLAQAAQHAQQQAGEPVDGEEPSVGDVLDEPDPWAEKIRGELTAKDIVEKLKAADGVIPEELLDLEHEYVYGEGEDAERQRMTLRDALDLGHKERMQLRDYHRRVHEVHNFEQQVVARGRAMETAIKGLNNPDTMIEDLHGLGVTEEALEAAVRKYAQQKLAYQRATPEQRAWLDSQKKQRQDMLALQREVAELRSVKEHGEQQQFQSQAKSVLRTHMGEAFKKHGLNIGSEFAKSKFQFFLERACDGKAPTREHIYQAAMAAKQDIAVAEREDRAAQAKARVSGGKPIGPRSAAAPAALRVPAQANGRKRGFTVSQLEDKIG